MIERFKEWFAPSSHVGYDSCLTTESAPEKITPTSGGFHRGCVGVIDRTKDRSYSHSKETV